MSDLMLNNIVTWKSRLGVTQGTIRKTFTVSKFAFHCNYGCILYHFGDKAIYWSKIVIFKRITLL